MENNIRLAPAQAIVPQYRNLRFKTPVELNNWLEETATKKVFFEDWQQHLQVMWLDDHGEVLNCNAQGWPYIGHLVLMESLTVGKPLLMRSEDDSEYASYAKLVVERIEELKVAQSA